MNSRTKGNSLIAAGTACFGVVILTHVAESFHIFPSLGWGQPDSVGHYLDLTSAVLGFILIPLGLAKNCRYSRSNRRCG